jgi:hypothetical protein
MQSPHYRCGLQPKRLRRSKNRTRRTQYSVSAKLALVSRLGRLYKNRRFSPAIAVVSLFACLTSDLVGSLRQGTIALHPSNDRLRAFLAT